MIAKCQKADPISFQVPNNDGIMKIKSECRRSLQYRERQRRLKMNKFVLAPLGLLMQVLALMVMLQFEVHVTTAFVVPNKWRIGSSKGIRSSWKYGNNRYQNSGRLDVLRKQKEAGTAMYGKAEADEKGSSPINIIGAKKGDVKVKSELQTVGQELIDSETIKDAVDNGNTICRIAATADGKLPRRYSSSESNSHGSSSSSFQTTTDKIDAIYNAISNQHLKIMSTMDNVQNNITTTQTLRESLENSGFQLLSQRDLDLCSALNSGYLLRLSIAPDVKDLDPGIYHEFYPPTSSSPSSSAEENEIETVATREQDLLFGGRILVFRRGYSQENTSGRLILPKLDYLQSSLVQRSASAVARRIATIDDFVSAQITSRITSTVGQTQTNIQSTLDGWKDKILVGPDTTDDESDVNSSSNGNGSVNKNAVRLQSKIKLPLEKGVDMLKNATAATGESLENTLADREREKSKKGNPIKLERYAGTANVKFLDSPEGDDALSPFLVCEVNLGGEAEEGGRKSEDTSSNIGVSTNGDMNAKEGGGMTKNVNRAEQDLLRGIESGDLTCKYDKEGMKQIDSDSEDQQQPIHLLERVSIANLVDFFSKGGRRRLIKSFFSVSELVEPTYEEVVLIWRPLQKKTKKKKVILPPKFLYDILEIFELEHKLPQPPKPEPEPDPYPIQIRTFDRVPMANLLAVLPKTKLIFRPADALIFDLVNVFTLLAVLSSQKFDSPKLDIIALVSVCLWFLRTFFRYSNKIARYDLLVNKFLTQRISHRNEGALKYITGEASEQRAIRAALVHEWLLDFAEGMRTTETDLEAAVMPRRTDLIRIGPSALNSRLEGDQPLFINLESALDDLEDLGIITFDQEDRLNKVLSGNDCAESLASIWNRIFKIM